MFEWWNDAWTTAVGTVLASLIGGGFLVVAAFITTRAQRPKKPDVAASPTPRDRLKRSARLSNFIVAYRLFMAMTPVFYVGVLDFFGETRIEIVVALCTSLVLISLAMVPIAQRVSEQLVEARKAVRDEEVDEEVESPSSAPKSRRPAPSSNFID